MKFFLHPESFSIHRLPPDRRLDLERFGAASWYSVTRTSDELSVVAPEAVDLGASDRQAGLACLQIAGVLSFGMVGIIAGIAGVLADANISIFAVSTYNTDYFLIRKNDVDAAVHALRAAGHVVVEAP